MFQTEVISDVHQVPLSTGDDVLGPETIARELPETTDDASPETDVELAPGPEETRDPTRSYLREMGGVHLLTKQGEVRLAKQIERGERLVLKAISRSPVT
ncbi:MAG TPA: sigma-70 factor domain-containing protein, partial [Nitrospira sp.]|nr:sigma-70 factor domain-containing protein [Nitrospira sp.]